MNRAWRSLEQIALLGTALLGLAAGGLLHIVDARSAGRLAWVAATSIVLVPTIVAVVRGLQRRETGVDIIAVMAMMGALLLGEYLAGAIIAVMLTGGTSLERFAVARARRELSALLRRAPRVAHRRSGADVVDVDVGEVILGDLLVVKPGEVIPADGVLTSETAILDESALTGESRPVQIQVGAPVRSGGTNAGGTFEVRVTAPADESTYAGIIRLVRAAEESKAPFVRLADRYARGFLTPRKRPEARALAHGLASAHRSLRPHVGELAALAARLDTLPGAQARRQLEEMRDLLEKELLPHEWEEQQTAFPVIAGLLKDEDPTGPLTQTHHEIHRLIRLFGRLAARLPPEGPRPEDLRDLRRALYGLHAILTLHFAQEEELYALLES